MNSTLLVITALCTSFIACNTPFEKQRPPAPDAEPSSVINCYRFASATDTIELKLIHVGQEITGTLVYLLHEKDSNKGTIQGSMRGDVLIADYTFSSEGVTSVRQVAFKKSGDSFVEGYGDLNTSDNKISFKDPDQLQFNSTMPLSEIDCEP